MVDRYLQQTPLAALGLAARAATGDAVGAGVTLREHAYRGLLLLRGDPRKPFCDAVTRVVGTALPLTPNVASGALPAPRLLWLGPDEWLIVTAPDEEASLAQALRESLAGQFATVLDISDGRAAIGVEGPHARELLMKGCAIDLHPRAFGPGQCAQTLLGRASILLDCSGPELFDVYIARSLAEYLWTWLEDGAAEFSVAVGSEPR